MNSNNHSNIHKVFLVISLLSLGVGLSGVGPEWFHGEARAVGGVSFILFFIFNLLKDEKMDGDHAHAPRRVTECDRSNNHVQAPMASSTTGAH